MLLIVCHCGCIIQVAELNSRIAEHSTELEELKGVVSKQKQDQKKLMSEMTGIEQLNHGIERCVPTKTVHNTIFWIRKKSILSSQHCL